MNKSVHALTAGIVALATLQGCDDLETQVADEDLQTDRLLTIGDLELSLDPQFGRVVIEGRFGASDGSSNRFKWYEHIGRDDAYVIFLNGRSEFVEKYDFLFTSLREFPETLSDEQTLADLPVSVITLDHAGQGESVQGRTAGHIDDFDTFVEDLRLLISTIRKFEDARKPIYIVSHSMGGLVAARFAQQYPEYVDGLVFESPLFDIRPVEGLPPGALQGVAAFYARAVGLPKLCTAPQGIDQQTLVSVALCASGNLEAQLPGCQMCFNAEDGCGVPEVQGLQQAFAYLQSIGDDGCPLPNFQCPAPFLTTDPDACEYSQTHPLAGPEATFGWLDAAFTAIDELQSADPIQAPTLILSNPDDVIVDPTAHTCDAFAGACTVMEFPGQGHELYTGLQNAQAIEATQDFIDE